MTPSESLNHRMVTAYGFPDRSMGCGLTTAIFMVLGVYISMQHQYFVAGHSVPPSSDVASGPGSNGNNNQRGRARSLVLGPRMSGSPQYIRARLTPIEPAAELLNDFVIDDEDLSDFSKRQSDDYGHMRFGKRGEQFDDYGHMRFGRSVE